MTPSDDPRFDLILDQLKEMRQEIRADFKALHTPLDCPVAEKVQVLQLSEARRKGSLAVIGAIAGTITAFIVSTISGLVFYLLRRSS